MTLTLDIVYMGSMQTCKFYILAPGKIILIFSSLRIMLGLCTHEKHFSLLREEVKFGKQTSRAVSV